MNDGGRIVNIASVLGCGVLKAVSAYAVSKAAVVQLTKAMALELARSGIRVNALAPGYFATDINREFLESEAGAQLMTRTEFIRTRTVDGESSLQTIAPTRLRARLRAQARHLKLLAEFQDARILGDPIGAARMGIATVSRLGKCGAMAASAAPSLSGSASATGTRTAPLQM